MTTHSSNAALTPLVAAFGRYHLQGVVFMRYPRDSGLLTH